MVIPKRVYFCAVCVLLWVTGCDFLENQNQGKGACTAIALPAIRLKVVSASGDPLPPSSAVVQIRDGSFVDSTQVTSSDWTGLAHERSGTYTIVVEKPGYQTWTKAGVKVERDRCHVQTVELVAELRPKE